MRIYIGKRDIEKAKLEKDLPDYTQHCPIAQALKRKFPDKSCWAGLTSAGVEKQLYLVCKIGMKLINDFDSNRKVNPTKIILKEMKLNDWAQNRG
jgi:hypothetical protein